MSLANDANLLLIPSGYKAGKVYSQFPINGGGDFTFSRTGQATRVNQVGLIETVETDVPRLDYSDSTCPSLLLEPQRTNYIKYSSDFSSWSVFNGGSISSNEIIAPNGELVADKLITNGTGFSFVRPATNPTISTGDNTFTIFAKKGTSDELWLRLDYGTTIYNRKFNLTTQTISAGFDNTSNIPNEESIEDYGNGWYRLTITDIADTTSFEPRIYVSDATSNNGDSVYLFGAQLEQGSYPTSYIPTTSSAATRIADVCNNAGNADLFNDSEGVLYAEISALNNVVDVNSAISISDGSLNNSLYLYLDNTGKYGFAVFSSGSLVCNIKTDINDLRQTAKLACKYSLNSFDLYLNGIKIISDTSGNTPIGLSKLSFHNGQGIYNFYGNLKDLRYFNTALTHTELQQLTTL